ncbi:MAG: hypothetical protein C4330_08715 [Chitinophagaceae bacterium]
MLTRFEAIIPDKAYAGKKLEYFMKDEEIIVTGSNDKREASNIFKHCISSKQSGFFFREYFCCLS